MAHRLLQRKVDNHRRLFEVLLDIPDNWISSRDVNHIMLNDKLLIAAAAFCDLYYSMQAGIIPGEKEVIHNTHTEDARFFLDISRYFYCFLVIFSFKRYSFCRRNGVTVICRGIDQALNSPQYNELSKLRYLSILFC